MGEPYSWKDIYRFSLFHFVFEGNFQVQTPGRPYIWRGDLTEGFLRYEFGGLVFGGAYTWRGYGIVKTLGLVRLTPILSYRQIPNPLLTNCVTHIKGLIT